MSADPNIRVSNDQRDRAVAELRKHLKAGRLSEAEFEARSARVAQAGTVGDVDAVFSDLPRAAPKGKRNVGTDWRLWAGVSLVTWAIWGVDVITSKGHPLDGVWPLWVTVPWGAVVLWDSFDRD